VLFEIINFYLFCLIEIVFIEEYEGNVSDAFGGSEIVI
jgi:hypothetical protein